MERLQHLEVTPASVIVLEVSEILSLKQQANLRAQLERVWPQNIVLVLDPRVKLRVFTGGVEVVEVV